MWQLPMHASKTSSTLSKRSARMGTSTPPRIVLNVIAKRPLNRRVAHPLVATKDAPECRRSDSLLQPTIPIWRRVAR